MTKRMDVNITFGKTRLTYGCLHGTLDATYGHRRICRSGSASADCRENKSVMAMRFPVSTQHIQGCNRKRYHSVFGPFAAMDMNEHPVAVDVAHFQVERLLETKIACIDSEEIGVVVGSSHRGEEFYDLLFGEDGGKNISD